MSTVFADPRSPETPSNGHGPQKRNAANSQATTKTNSVWLRRLRKAARSPMAPSCSGTGSGKHAGGPAEPHGRETDHSPPLWANFGGSPMRIGEIINVPLIFRDADIDGPLHTVELRKRFEQNSPPS